MSTTRARKHASTRARKTRKHVKHTIQQDLPISYRPLNTSLRIQSLQFTSAPWSTTPRKQFNDFKQATLWHTTSRPFFEGHYFMKHAKDESTPSSQSMPSTRPCQEHEHGKHLSTQALHLADSLRWHLTNHLHLTLSVTNNFTLTLFSALT